MVFHIIYTFPKWWPFGQSSIISFIEMLSTSAQTALSNSLCPSIPHGRGVELFFWNLRLPPSCDICQKKPPYWTSRKSTAQEMAVRLSVSRRLFLATKYGPVPLAVITVRKSHLWWNSLGKGFRISCASLKSKNHWKGLMETIQIISYVVCFFEFPCSHHALPSTAWWKRLTI